MEGRRYETSSCRVAGLSLDMCRFWSSTAFAGEVGDGKVVMPESVADGKEVSDRGEEDRVSDVLTTAAAAAAAEGSKEGLRSAVSMPRQF